MQRVIVTVQLRGEETTRDLEVPAEVPSQRLAHLIARALRWEDEASDRPADFQVEVHPLGQRLAADESLADAGIWDGAWLVLTPAQTPVGTPVVMPADSVPVAAQPVEAPPVETPPVAAPPVPRPVAVATRGPLSGWRALDIEVPSGGEDEAEAGDSGGASGYRWKRLDG